MAVDTLLLLQLVPAAATLALAAWLLVINFDSRLNRALALLLLLRAMVTILNRVATLDPARSELWTGLREYYFLAILPAMAYFAAVAAWPRGDRTGRAVVLAAASTALVAEIVYALDHCTARCATGDGLVRVGPLALLVDGTVLGEALIGVGLALAALRRTDARAVALALAAAPFLLLAAFEGALAAAVYARGVVAFEASVWASLVFPLRIVALVPALAGAALVSRLARQRGRRVVLVVAHFALALASGVAVGSTPADGSMAVYALALSAAWLLAIPLLLAYAILKYRLFDLDARVQRGMSRAFIAGAFLATFFVVSEVVQNWLDARYGVTAGGVATGLLLFALAPLQRMGERVSRAAVPGGRPVAQMSREERLALYRDQAVVAWSDGTLSRKERLLLDQLRERLAIDPEEALRLERAAL